MSDMDRLGKYRLDRRLAQGGMGAVWVAYDEQLQRQVALKLMLGAHAASEHQRRRFEQEAQMIARLQHPNVVQIFEYGTSDDNVPYIAMELLEGEDLATRLASAQTMALAGLVPILLQAAKALDTAHRAGIVHRDLKPGNIYLARHGSETLVKILDLGIATFRSAAIDRDESVHGTLHFMSPEQSRGDVVDARSDLWSLAVVAYLALTGTLPFRGTTAAEVAATIRDRPHRPPSELVAELGSEVDAFFDRALAKEPQLRFASALEMAAAFSELDQDARRPIKMLVVDDEPDLAVLLKRRFRRQIAEGAYEFIFASNGEEALERLRDNPDTDIVLTDINMPGMDGLTFLGKASQVGPVLRAIVISAYSDMTNIRQAMNRGAFDFLVKPLDFKDLQTTLQKAARSVRELRRALRSAEENHALRMFVDNSLLERVLPMLRVSNELRGESVEGTVVCIDIFGVREFSRNAEAAELVELLNRNFDVIVPAIGLWKGKVIRFVGDSVLAVFQRDDHLSRGIGAAAYIRAKLEMLAEEHGADPYARGVCVGIDSGTIIAGSVGSISMRRLDFAILGDVVSNALLLQQAAKRNEILMPERLVERIDNRVIWTPADPDTPLPYKAASVVEVSEAVLAHGPLGLHALATATRTAAGCE